MNIVYLAFIEIDISNACLIHTREIAEQMAALGHQVTVVMPRPLRSQMWKNVKHIWIKYWGFDRPREWFFFVESALRILYRHNRRRFDIIYVREMERNFVLLFLARRMKCPLFVEVNGWLLDDLSLTGATADRIAAAKKHQQKLFDVSQGIFVSTHGNAERLGSVYNVRGRKTFVQELGVNTGHFAQSNQNKAREQLGLSFEHKIILFAGSFHPHHDLKTLLEAFSYVVKESPGSILLLLGTGAQFHIVKEKINTLNIENKVILPGVRSYDEMPVWFQAADIAVLPLTSPNIRQRNGCITLKLWEYMAAGLPVVATDLPDTRSAPLLADKIVIVPPEDPRAVGNALLRLLNSENLRRRLSVAGMDYVRMNRTWHRAASETLDFIERRLQDHP